MARRMISITRLIPDHEFANLDGFVSPNQQGTGNCPILLI